MAVNFDPDRALRGWFDHIRNMGLVNDCCVREDFASDSFRLDFILPNGRDYHAIITRSELAMGGPEELWRWTQHVERGIAHELERNRGATAPPPSYTASEINARRAEAEFRMQHAQAEMQRQMEIAQLRINPRWLGTDFAWDPAPKDPKAENRSKDLFKLACGEDAFQTLESGKALPITGSKGTKYTLHKRASFCIERPSDGARLCAVVPNVPLWDHLLGIKLMVENDEEKFLKTANVAGGYGGMRVERNQHHLDALRYGLGVSIRHPNSIIGGNWT